MNTPQRAVTMLTMAMALGGASNTGYPMPPNDYPHRHSTSTRKQRKARKAERQNRKKNRR